MARIPDISTAATYNTYPWRTIWGPGAIKMGPVNAAADAMHAAMAGIGLTSGGIDISPGQTSSARFSDQTYNPSDYKVTGWEWVITTALDQMDVWNMALALSYPQTAITTSSSFLITGTHGPPKYKCVQVITEAAAQSAANQGGKEMQHNFFRCKVVSGGSTVYNRDTPTTAPIEIHACANGTDTVGYIAVDETTVPNPHYEVAA